MSAEDQDVRMGSIDAAWKDLWEAQAALSDEAMRTPAADGGWAPTSILGHCARWNEAGTWLVRRHLAGELTPSDLEPYEGSAEDAMNTGWGVEDATARPEDVRSRLLIAHQDLRNVLVGLKPEQWDEFVVDWGVGLTSGHYPEHTATLRQLG